MDWPTWEQAFVTAAVAALVALTTRGRTGAFARTAHPAARELTGVAVLYGLWRIARTLPLDQPEGAIERGRAIWELQQRMGLPSELALQRWFLDHDLLARLANAYYAIVHVPALVAFLIWLWVRRRDHYPHHRNGLVGVTAGCLVLRYVRVAPPRFLPDLGFVDLSTRYGLSVYGPVGTGVSDQFAAMPSIHCGWAAVVAWGVWTLAPRGWRWLGPIHLLVTFVVVAATGNHWWLDGIVAVAILAIVLAVDARVRARGTPATVRTSRQRSTKHGTDPSGSGDRAHRRGGRGSAGGVRAGRDADVHRHHLDRRDRRNPR